jgi:hypothetical protein
LSIYIDYSTFYGLAKYPFPLTKSPEKSLAPLQFIFVVILRCMPKNIAWGPVGRPKAPHGGGTFAAATPQVLK